MTALFSLLFITSCDDSSSDSDTVAAGGTIIVAVTGQEPLTGTSRAAATIPCYAYIFADGADTSSADPLASGELFVPFSETTVSVTLTDSSDATWSADSDTAYDFYLFIDQDGSGSTPNAGDIYPSAYWPKEYSSINSDTTVSLDLSDFDTALE